jgi:septum formation protein
MGKDFIYLASASPRRAELLGQIGVAFERRPADVDESPHPDESPDHLVRRLSAAKAEAVWQRLAADDVRPVLAADTVVVIDGKMLGKPADRRAALQMLETLSGRTHQVLTAVAVRGGRRAATLVASSKVRLRATTPTEREAYCETGEPYDKAGAYGVQGFGGVFVEHLEGSYSCVMGLPLIETVALLRPFGLPRWLPPEEALP